jgi:hypothetical protein
MEYKDFLQVASDGARQRETEIVASMERVVEAMVHLLADGRRVNTPLGIFQLALREEKHNREHTGRENRIGRGDEVEFTVTPERLKVVFRPNRQFSARIRKLAKIARDTDDHRPWPVINAFYCVERVESEPDAIAPGELLLLEGHRLSFDSADAETGLFFVDGEGAAFRAAVYARAGSNIVIAKCPPLEPGSYVPEIRTRPTGKGVRETMRAGVVRVVRAPAIPSNPPAVP